MKWRSSRGHEANEAITKGDFLLTPRTAVLADVLPSLTKALGAKLRIQILPHLRGRTSCSKSLTVLLLSLSPPQSNTSLWLADTDTPALQPQRIVAAAVRLALNLDLESTDFEWKVKRLCL